MKRDVLKNIEYNGFIIKVYKPLEGLPNCSIYSLKYHGAAMTISVAKELIDTYTSYKKGQKNND